MHDIDTFLLRTFIILSESRNFTQTANKIGRSQSAVSMQIAKLESQLDCQLFSRNKRQVALTPDGEKLKSYAKQIIALSDALIERFREPDIEGVIRFGSPEDFATFYLPDILSSFTSSHPKVTLNVNCDLTLSLIDGFEKNHYDLIIIKQAPDNLYQGAQPLWRERLVWVTSPHAKSSIDFNSYLSESTPLPLILSPAPCVYRARITSSLDAHSASWKVAFTSPSVAGAVAAVRAGLGYTALPREMVPGDLMILDQAAGWPELQDAEICLLARQNSSAAILALINYITQHLTFNQKN